MIRFFGGNPMSRSAHGMWTWMKGKLNGYGYDSLHLSHIQFIIIPTCEALFSLVDVAMPFNQFSFPVCIRVLAP